MKIDLIFLKRVLENNKMLSCAEIGFDFRIRAGTKDFYSLQKQLEIFENQGIILKNAGKYKLVKPYLTGIFNCGKSNRNFIINKTTGEKKWVKNDFWEAQTGDEVNYTEFAGFGFGSKSQVIVRAKIAKMNTYLSLVVMDFKNKMPVFQVLFTKKSIFQKKNVHVKGQLPKLTIGLIISVILLEIKQNFLVCVFRRVQGKVSDFSAETLSVLLKNDVHLSFSENVIAEANALELKITKDSIKERRDLRKRNLITIDPSDSKDFDDAIYVAKNADGNYCLIVAIADVSHFVTENSALDGEAYWRGASLYLLNKVIPMLPKKLSADLCSLKPNLDRFAQVVEMIINEKGETISYDIYPAIINSHRRCSYDEVNAFFNNQGLSNSTVETRNCLLNSKKLHHVLRKMMVGRGFIDFEIAESKITVDDKGKPLSVGIRSRGEAQKMIEDFMIRANECVARHFSKVILPAIYRVHERPGLRKIERLRGILQQLKVKSQLPSKGEVEPSLIQKLVSDIHVYQHHEIIATLLLRSMEKARYDCKNKGHFGLASDCYTHFTSPIRRYPDLIVHRLLKTYFFEKKQDSETKNYFKNCLPAIAEQCSINETKIITVERAVNDLKKAQYMLTKKNLEFKGVITTVTFFGFFVQLFNTIEGLVPVKTLSDDYYAYLPQKEMLKGARWKQKIQVGDFVLVKFASANLTKGQIEFSLVKHTGDSIWHKS